LSGSEEELLFVRPSSGLTKAITMRTGWAVALSAILLPYLWTMVPIMPNIFPGIHLGLAFAIGGIFSVTEAAASALLLIAMPRSGGMYVTVGRTLGPVFGVMELWRSSLNTAMLLGLSSFLMVQSIGQAFTTIGTMIVNPGLVAAGALMATVPVAAGSAVVVMVLLGLLHYFGPGLDAKIMTVFQFIVIACMIGCLGLFATTPTTLVQARWDSVWGAGSYSGIQTYATGAGYTPPPFDLSQTFLGLAWASMMAPYCLIVYAGEVSEPPKTTLWSTMIAGIAFPLLWGSVAFTMQNTYGAFLGQFNVAEWGGYSVPFSSNVALFAASLTNNPALAGFVILAPAFAVIGSIPGLGYGWISRTMYAASMDRFMPEIFSRTSKYGSPTYSIVFAMIVSLAGIFLSATGSWLVVGVSYIATWFMVRWWWNIAEIMLPFTKKDIYEASSVRPMLLGIPIIAIVGLITGAYMMYLLWAWAATLDPLSMVLNASVYVIGLGWFIGYSMYHQRKGIDITKIFAELPPE
jgi:amino acid transporter